MTQKVELTRYFDPSTHGALVPSQESSAFTWEAAVRILRKNRWLALGLAAGLTLATGVFAYSLHDVYQPTARLEIDPLNSGIKTLHEIEDSRATDNQDYLETQVQILQSEGLAMRVIRALHLEQSAEFVPQSQQSKLEKTQSRASKDPASKIEDASFLKEHLDLADRTPAESAALAAFQKRLSISPVRNSRLIEVSYAGQDPQTSQAVTNALVSEFIDQNFRNRYTSTMEASEWLSTQLDGLKRKVEQSNQAVTDYQKKFNLVEADDRDVPTNQLMGDVNHQLSDAQANRMEAEAYVRMIDQGQSEAIPAVRDDQLYQNLMTRFVDVRAQLAQARAVYGDENSNVKRLQDEAAELAAQVESERARMVNRVRTSFAAALAREQMMTASREKLRAEMGDASSHLVTYRMLKNEAVANAELYNTLQGRLKEAGIYAGLKSSNIHIVDLAPKLARPTGPHRTLIIGAGAMLSCMFALILPFIRESLDHTVRTPGDIKETIGLATLAMIPRMNGKWAGPPRPVVPLGELNGAQDKLLSGNAASGIPLIRPLTPESEAIRDLRTGILLANTEIAPRVVLVSSPTAGEGKTTVAVNLAIVLAQSGKTCLVEGDLRRPKATSAFGLRSKTGLSSVLENGTPLSAAVANLPEFPTLTILSAGPRSTNPGDLLASGQMKALITALRNVYEYVVIDSPPVIPFSDARTLSRLVDAVVLVGRYGVTTRRSMDRSVELLDEVRAPILGAVLNDIDLSSADYHYFNYGYSSKVGASGQYYDANELPASAAASQSGGVNKKGAHA